MTSPLATYIHKANTGASASQYQAISILSDFKDTDNTKTTHKVLQSPPEFTSPLDFMPQKHHHYYNQLGLEPILESRNLESRNNNHFASQHSNLNNQKGVTTNKVTMPSSFYSHPVTSKQHSEKLSFSQFYEQTVSPHNRGLHKQQASFHRPSQSIVSSDAKGKYPSPFSMALANLNKSGISTKIEAETRACDLMMEQIAAMIDYDVADYLPSSAQSNLDPKTSNRKHPKMPLTNNYLTLASTSNDQQTSYHGQSSRFSHNKELKFVSKTPQNKILKKHSQHSGFVKDRRHSSKHVTSKGRISAQSIMLTNDEPEVDDYTEEEADEQSSCDQGSQQSCCDESASYCRGRSYKARHNGDRRNRSRIQLHDCTEQSSDEDDHTTETGHDHHPPSCSMQQHSKRHHHRNRNRREARRQPHYCNHSQTIQHQHRVYCSGKHHQCTNSFEEKSSQKFRENTHQNSKSFSQEYEYAQSVEAVDRQKLAMMILQGDSSVQIVKQDDMQSSLGYPKASPRFQLQISQSEQNDKTHINLLQSLIKTSDFQQMVRQQPDTSRNSRQQIHQQSNSQGHILVSNGCSGGSPSRFSHSRHQSAEALPQSNNMFAPGLAQTSSECIHLTQINPTTPFGAQSIADLSQQSNTITEIQQALIEQPQHQPQSEAQTSFSQLYQPYMVAQPTIVNQPLATTASSNNYNSAGAPETEDPNHELLKLEQQTSFAPNQSERDEPLKSQTQIVKPPKMRKSMSLTQSVIHIQRAYRIYAAEKRQSDNQSLTHVSDQDDKPCDTLTSENLIDESSTGMNAMVQQKNETSPLDRKSLKSTCENESSDIELPDMFEYDNWWLEAETPMTDQCLSAFLKKHM